jgi:Cu(I)/Ag(I) efflux system membrane fusion protein
MKKNLIVATLVAISTLAPVACKRAARTMTTTTSTTTAETKVEKAADIYTCPMHPTIVSHSPGHCPICGMTLVKRVGPSAATEPAADHGVQAIALSPEQRVTANVSTVEVQLATHTGELVATGRVTFDERRVAQITSYTAGRIEKLYADFTGDAVRRGDTVATIYSPDLFATQQEYLLSLQNRERMRRAGFDNARSSSEDLVESTRRRLALFGMTSAQIAQLERSGKPIFATNIVAPVSGIVTKKLALEQQYVAQGQPLFEVADLSHVWVEADVYEQQLPDVKVGQAVEITSAASPGKTFHGKVGFIQPVLTGATRTARVRIELPNPSLALKPDMYVNVRMIGEPAPPHIMVPASAIVDRGQKRFVWVESRPGTYEPREVRTGQRHGDAIVVVEGVRPGDHIVIEGGFLLDSEAQLRGVAATAQGRQP